MSSTPSPLSSRTASPLPIWVVADTTLLLLRSYNEGDLGPHLHAASRRRRPHTRARTHTHMHTMHTFTPRSPRWGYI